MHRFWKPVIKPLFDSILPGDILEIGSGTGLNTQNIVEYAKINNAFVHTVDPDPDFDAVGLEKLHQGFVKFYFEKSLNALPRIDKYDVVLIDGDHNWYTVFNELLLIEASAQKWDSEFPLVLLHDVCWPYGRRDLYYDPSTIPENFRKPHTKQGIIPGCTTTINEGGLNFHLYNAVSEHGSHNGVHTAIEDFLAQTKRSLKLKVIPILHGLGILYPQALSSNKAFCTALESFCFSDDAGLIELVENQRIDTLIKLTNQQKQIAKYQVQLAEKSMALSKAEKMLRKEVDSKMRDAAAWENLTLQYKNVLRKLEVNLHAILRSNRWKIGNAVVNTINRFFLRKTEVIAVNIMQEIFAESKKWKKELFRSSDNKTISLSNATPVVWRYSVSETELLQRVRQYNVQKSGRKAKVVVYTAIIGAYDPLILPETISDEWDYVVFSDQEIPGEHIFEVRRPDYSNNDPVRIARYLKMHPHIFFPEYEYSVWIDSNILVRGTHLRASVKDCCERNVLIMFNPHPDRTCIYDELEACIKYGKDDRIVMEKQVANYRAEGFPESMGMFETNILIRKHNDKQVKVFSESWWKEIDNGSRRDQLSITYVIWKQKLPYEILPGMKDIRNHEDNDYCLFLHRGHRNSRIPMYRQPFFMRTNGPQPAIDDTQICDQVRAIEQLVFSPDDLKSLKEERIDIIVCVHNAIDDVRNCINSVLENMLCTHRLILVDDGSDTETREFLDRVAGEHTSIYLLRHNVAKGYTRAANAGIRAAAAPFLILLNSDTIVSANWALKLLQAARSSPEVGIVGPMSNAASWQSLPLVVDPSTGGLAVNELPPRKSVADMDKLCEKYGWFGQFPRVPLVNGFCYGIKREVIETVGYLDEEAFPMGYGEEDDFSQRALDAGYVHAIATHCYVFHAKSKSFGSDVRKKLAEKGGRVLRSRYGEERIHRAVHTMRNNPLLQRVRREVSAACKMLN